MFTIDISTNYSNIAFPKVQDEAVNGIRYSVKPFPYVGEKSGCALVMQYLGTLFNKIGYSSSINQIHIDNIYDRALSIDKAHGKEDILFPTMASSLQACLDLDYVKNADFVVFNDVKTFKWYMHEYKNVVVQLKLTSTTKNAYQFDIGSHGEEFLNGKYSKGFIAMEYDENSLVLQNSLGENVGAKGFNRINWTTFNSLFVDGATFKIKV